MSVIEQQHAAARAREYERGAQSSRAGADNDDVCIHLANEYIESVRRVAVIVLTLVAAFVSPLRQGCGIACGNPPAASARVQIAEPQPDESCHKQATPPPESVPAPASERCSHDHDGALAPSARTTTESSAGQAMVAAPLAPAEIFLALTPAGEITPHLAPGSPPFLRHTPLRV